MSTFVIGISGASGAPYGIRLLEVLVREGHDLHVVFSTTGRSIVADECQLPLGPTPESAANALSQRCPGPGAITVHGEGNLYAAIASGSFLTDGMAVVPCSMKALAAISHGYGDGLLARAADVHLKEGRPLILVPREAPFSAIHLENMLKLSRLAAVRIVPAMPAFYSRPQSINDLIDFVVARILDHLAPGVTLSPRWTGPHPLPITGKAAPD